MILKINMAIDVLSSQDGNDNCSRKACPSLSCRYQIQDENACCSRCAVNRAEVRRERHIIMASYDDNKIKTKFTYRAHLINSWPFFISEETSSKTDSIKEVEKTPKIEANQGQKTEKERGVAKFWSTRTTIVKLIFILKY